MAAGFARVLVDFASRDKSVGQATGHLSLFSPRLLFVCAQRSSVRDARYVRTYMRLVRGNVDRTRCRVAQCVTGLLFATFPLFVDPFPFVRSFEAQTSLCAEGACLRSMKPFILGLCKPTSVHRFLTRRGSPRHRSPQGGPTLSPASAVSPWAFDGVDKVEKVEEEEEEEEEEEKLCFFVAPRLGLSSCRRWCW